MTDLSQALAAAREAVRRASFRQRDDYVDVALRDLLAAIDAAPVVDGLTAKQAWWAGARAALGIEADTPREEVAAAFLCAAERAKPAPVAVPADNVTPLRQPRLDLARLVDAISATVYDNGKGLSVTEAIGALELAKLELLKEQER